MNLAELAMAVGLGLLVSTAAIQPMVVNRELVRAQQDVARATAIIPHIRSCLNQLAGQATSVTVYEEAAPARAGGVQGLSGEGGSLRIEHAGGVNAGGRANWSATLERVGQQLLYRNQDGVQWVVAEGVTSIRFDIREGMLRTWVTAQGTEIEIWTAVN